MSEGHLRVAIYIPGHDRALEERRVLLHCDQRGYEAIGIGIGERAWPGVAAMLRNGEVQRIVTVANGGHTTGPGVEVAGAGRTTIRTPARAKRLREIADLIDSPLSIEEIVRILRR